MPARVSGDAEGSMADGVIEGAEETGAGAALAWTRLKAGFGGAGARMVEVVTVRKRCRRLGVVDAPRGLRLAGLAPSYRGYVPCRRPQRCTSHLLEPQSGKEPRMIGGGPLTCPTSDSAIRVDLMPMEGEMRIAGRSACAAASSGRRSEERG